MADIAALTAQLQHDPEVQGFLRSIQGLHPEQVHSIPYLMSVVPGLVQKLSPQAQSLISQVPSDYVWDWDSHSLVQKPFNDRHPWFLPAVALGTAGLTMGMVPGVPGIPGMPGGTPSPTHAIVPAAEKAAETAAPHAASMWPLVAGQVGAAGLSAALAPDPYQKRTGFSGDADPNAWMGDVHNLLGKSISDWQSHMDEPAPEIPFANLEMHGNPGATSPRRVAGTAPVAPTGAPTSPARAPLSLGPTAPPAAAAPPTDDPLLQTPPGRNPQSQGAAALLLHTLMDRSRHVPQQGAR